MTHKVIITKPTFNALTETDPQNMIFSSDFNTLKYYTSGSLVINVDVGADTEYSYTNFFTHSLGYFPFHIIYVKYGTNWEMIGTNYVTAGYGSGSGVYRKFEGWVTENRLYVKARGDADGVPDSYSADFRYKLFKNNLGL